MSLVKKHLIKFVLIREISGLKNNQKKSPPNTLVFTKKIKI